MNDSEISHMEQSHFKNTFRFLVTCAPGLEKLLKEECEMLLAPDYPVALEESAIVSFEGTWKEASKILLGSRLASKVLLSIRSFSARNVAMLYDQIRRISWPDYFTTHQSFAVFAHGDSGVDQGKSDFKISYAPLKIKDAICDEFRKRGVDRPSVDRLSPEARIEAFFHDGRCEVSLDLSGAPLHRRGYRKASSLAPLRENRAAALLYFASYKGERPLVDPFCGSGTIPIEAALIALKRAPGLFRPPQDFSCYRLFSEARAPFEEAREEALQKSSSQLKFPILAYDISRREIKAAQENAQRAGVEKFIHFDVREARTLECPEHSIVTNPPYGERLGSEEEAKKLLGEFTRQAKHHSAGSTLTLVLPQGGLSHGVGFKAQKKLLVGNGPLSTLFLHYELYAGSSKRA